MTTSTDRTTTSRRLGKLPEQALTDPPAAIGRQWGWMLALGIALILGGLAAILLPFAASVAVTAAVGAAFAVGGVLQLVHVFRCQGCGWRARTWSALSGAVYLGGAVLLLLEPLAGIVALTVAMIAVFLIDGLIRVAMGLRLRPERGWGWVTASGALSVLLAGALFLAVPGAPLVLLGLLAGVSLIFEGWSAVFMAFAAWRAVRRDRGDDAASEKGENAGGSAGGEATQPA